MSHRHRWRLKKGERMFDEVYKGGTYKQECTVSGCEKTRTKSKK